MTFRKLLLIGVAEIALIALIAIAPSLLTVQKWVGRTDIEVSFVVTDAETGQSISDATIHVRANRGGFCEDQEARNFTLLTDAQGVGRVVCKQCMCFGSRGTFEDTFASHLPPWLYHATAAGYADGEPAWLEVEENVARLRRGSPFATISTVIQLRRNTSEDSNVPTPAAAQ